jgi:hypothetical protein
MPKEFTMRGQTASAGEEVINISGYRPGYGYKVTEFRVYPSTNLGSAHGEYFAALTASKTAADPVNPDFNDDGLIGTAMFIIAANPAANSEFGTGALWNEDFVITQDLRLSCRETDGGVAVNWQIKFKEVKLSRGAEAVANFKQFSIFSN